MRECDICYRDFNENLPVHKAGKINHCGFCAKDVRKSIAVSVVNGKSDYHIEILTNPSVAQVKIVNRAGKHGPSHCHSSLGLNSNGATTPKGGIDKVQEQLDKTSNEESQRSKYGK